MNRKRMVRTIRLLLLVVVTTAVLTTGAANAETERKKQAREAQENSVKLGKALFGDAEFGTNGKSCTKCHENPDKPNLNLPERVGDFPKWERREKKVITIGQKINQMIVRNLKGEAMELGSEKLVALEAYLMSISKKGD